MTLQELVKAAYIDESGCGICERGAEQNVVGLVLAEDVIDQVGGHGHLPSGLLLTGMTALDQTRDDGADAEGALHQARLCQPCVEVVA
jgi:hypothetical protein